MSFQRRKRRRGFTLVEILIVVIILGILAAIVIPQFTNASTDAKASSLQSTLQTLRSQIQLYKLQHGDTLPNLITDWTPLTESAQYQGQSYGPYLQATPVNSINSNTNVVDSGSQPTFSGATPPAAGSVCGFVYDYESGAATATGQIYGTDSTGTNFAGTVANSVFSPY